MHVEQPEYAQPTPAILYHLGKRTLGYAQGIQRPQFRHHIDAAFARLDELHCLLLIESIVKDNPTQPRKTPGVPVVEIGFQDNLIRTHIGSGEPLHELIWARAPRALPVDHSPVLRAPPDIPIKLAVGHMHNANLRQRSTVWFREHE